MLEPESAKFIEELIIDLLECGGGVSVRHSASRVKSGVRSADRPEMPFGYVDCRPRAGDSCSRCDGKRDDGGSGLTC